MVYSDFQDIKLSALGLATMRLPMIDGDDSRLKFLRLWLISQQSLDNDIKQESLPGFGISDR